MPGTKRRPGRPAREPEEGERVGLSLRVTPRTRRALDTAAEKGGRSLSQEAEMRLERSFQAEELFPQLIDQAFGRVVSGLLMVIGPTVRNTLTASRISNPGRPRVISDRELLDDPAIFNAVVVAIDRLLRGMRPAGDVDSEAFTTWMGHAFAEGRLRSIAQPEIADLEWAAEARDRLGPAIAARIKDFLDREGMPIQGDRAHE